VSKPLAALFVLLSIAVLAGLFLSLAIVGLHIRENLRIDLEKMGHDCPVAAHRKESMNISQSSLAVLMLHRLPHPFYCPQWCSSTGTNRCKFRDL
jgi:hypothetical protein